MKNNAGDADGLLYDVMDSWLQLTEPSWEKLAEALDKSDYKLIARKGTQLYSYNIYILRMKCFHLCCDNW